MKTKKHRYTSGLSARITVSIVAEDCCEFVADSPESLHKYWQAVIEQQPDHEPEKERVVVVLVNTRLRAFAWHLVSLGSVNESTAHPREILRPVIVGAAHGFVVMHNHPSGDPSPSRADEQVTKRLVEAANIMQLRFLDHVVIGAASPERKKPYYSFREAGLIP